VHSSIAANVDAALAGRRFRAERQLVPDRLLVRPVPVDWFTPSWRIAAAFRVGGGGASPFTRAGPRILGGAYPGGEPTPEDTDEVMTALARITELVDAGNWYDGGIVAGRLVYDFPWCDVGYWKAAQCFRGLGQYQEALDSMVPAIALQPLQPVMWESLALCLDDLGDAASAAVAASVAEQLSELIEPPDHADPGAE
jgi:predicted Zn-dependent protease